MKPSLPRVVLCVCLVLAPVGLAAQAGSSPGGPGGGGRPRGAGGDGPVAQAEIGVSRVYTTVAGRLEPRLRIDHKVPLTGIIEEILVVQGQAVGRGDVLFSAKQDSPLDIYKPVEITSRLDGVVSGIHVEIQQEVTAGTAAVTVMDTTTMRLEAAVSDTDAFTLTTGVRVTGRNAAGTAISGTLTSVSAEPDYDTGLFTARFTFPRTPGIPIGTFLLIDVPVDEIRGIFVDPAAVIRRYGRNRIWTVDADGILQSVEVRTDRVIGGRVLIPEGLEPGTRYLTSPSGREQEGMALTEILGDRE